MPESEGLLTLSRELIITLYFKQIMLQKLKTQIRKKRVIYRIAIFLFNAFQYIKGTPLRDYFNLERWILFSKVSPFTMVPYLRLTNTYNLARLVEKKKIKGAFVECGVWKGGCSAITAFVAEKAKSNRKIWLFDSFEGMPEATNLDVGEEAKRLSKNRFGGELEPIGTNVATIEDCEKILFNRLHLNRDNIVFKKGWFQDTLPTAKQEIGNIAILRIDADWYESTKCCLENLYDNVVLGGYVVIDDYGYYPGCKRAVDEFIKGKNIKINKIDGIGIFFQKLY